MGTVTQQAYISCLKWAQKCKKILTYDWDIVKILEYAKNVCQKSVFHEYYHKYISSLPNIMFLGLYKS